MRSGTNIIWRCSCECGGESFVSGNSLRTGNTTSCGCGKKINMTGQKFGKLTAIEPTEKRSGSSIVWRCECECGGESFVSSNNLRTGSTTSCGCEKKIDIAGQKFGKLTAIEPTEMRSRG